MAASLNFAIMDRNPHVRELICRELGARGHAASPVRNASEAKGLLDGPTPPQVLVVDPETLEGHLGEIAQATGRLGSKLALVVHAFGDDLAPQALPNALLVEKAADLAPLLTLVDGLSRGFRIGAEKQGGKP